MQSNILPYLEQLYAESKFWLTLGGLLWAVFKGLNWVKELKTNDLAHLKTSVDGLKTELNFQTEALNKGFEKQTQSLVGELKELRQDFRSYLVPPPYSYVQSVAKKNRKPTRKTKRI